MEELRSSDCTRLTALYLVLSQWQLLVISRDDLKAMSCRRRGKGPPADFLSALVGGHRNRKNQLTTSLPLTNPSPGLENPRHQLLTLPSDINLHVPLLPGFLRTRISLQLLAQGCDL